MREWERERDEGRGMRERDEGMGEGEG